MSLPLSQSYLISKVLDNEIKQNGLKYVDASVWFWFGAGFLDFHWATLFQ